MMMLRDRYIQYIEEHYPQYYNPNHDTRKLKGKIISEFGDKISFWRPNYRSELVYSSNLQIGEAVEMGFEAATSESRILEDAALILHRKIQQAFNASPKMPWPPSSTYLNSGAITPPDSLTHFLVQVISGNSVNHATDKTSRLANSFAEDICGAATRGQWKLPKHLLLSVTLHHLFASSDVITLLNRYGHCQSYPLLLDLENAMASQVQLEDNVL